MESSESLAKKHGLEHYLQKPAQLNDAIFNLLLLQETMQLEQSRVMKINAVNISVRRPVTGKFVATCSGQEKYRYAVETALKASTFTVAVFQRSLFINILRNMGVPEGSISDFSDSITLDDDTHCIDQE
jgi:hypothetical protein